MTAKANRLIIHLQTTPMTSSLTIPRSTQYIRLKTALKLALLRHILHTEHPQGYIPKALLKLQKNMHTMDLKALTLSVVLHIKQRATTIIRNMNLKIRHFKAVNISSL